MPFDSLITVGDDPDAEETSFTDPGSERRLKMGDQIGLGGTAEVRSAVQTVLGRDVAVKIPLKYAGKAVGRHALLREAWVTGMLEHPNIVPVHDIDFRDGDPMIVMKRLDGVAWSEVVDRPAEEFPDADDALVWNLRVLLQVCNAIAFAHAQGILNRDIKPSNVMVGHFGAVWVVDWGLAVTIWPRADSRIPLASEVTRISGTPAYLPPEMGLVRPELFGTETDVFMLGAVLYRIVAGRPVRDPATITELIESLHTERIEIDPSWPLADLMGRALEPESRDRLASVDEFREEVQRHLEQRGTQRLLAAARARLGQLESGIELGEDRASLYDQLGACRFAFVEVLQGLPNHGEAVKGLQRATVAMARYELDSGDPRAARLLLDRSEAPPAGLHEQVEALAAQQEEEKRTLRRLEQDVDKDAYSVHRLLTLGIMGATWIGAPILAALVGLEGYTNELAITAPTTLVTIATMVVLLPWLTRTRLNRVAGVAVMLSPVLSGAVLIGAAVLDLPAEQATALKPIAFVAMTFMAALLGDLRLLPAAMIFLCMFWVGTLAPAWAPLTLGIANLVLLANAAAIWVPGLLRRSPGVGST